MNTNFNFDTIVSFSNNCNPSASNKTYVPDDNFEAYLEANGMGDGITNNDSVITSKIDTLSLLYIDNLSISDLAGIEEITNLSELSLATKY